MLTAKLDQLTHADLRKDSRTSVMFFTLTGAYCRGLHPRVPISSPDGAAQISFKRLD
jgi:hypothetical protein